MKQGRTGEPVSATAAEDTASPGRAPSCLWPSRACRDDDASASHHREREARHGGVAHRARRSRGDEPDSAWWRGRCGNGDLAAVGWHRHSGLARGDSTEHETRDSCWPPRNACVPAPASRRTATMSVSRSAFLGTWGYAPTPEPVAIVGRSAESPGALQTALRCSQMSDPNLECTATRPSC